MMPTPNPLAPSSAGVKPHDPQILVAGIGNIFMGDDAFGSEVAQRLLRKQYPANVRVVDFGIRGLDLVYALLDGYPTVILIDAVPRDDEPPGTLFVLEPNMESMIDASPEIDPHSMDPVKVLRTAIAMGWNPTRVLIVGCQPAVIPGEDDEFPSGLSAPVAAAVDEAVTMVESLIEQYSVVPNPLNRQPNVGSQENVPCQA